METLPLKHLTGFVILSNIPNNTPESRSVVVIIQHNENKGTMGLCINQPLNLKLNDFDENLWGNFDNIPVFRGGPVNPKQIILSAMEWDAQHQQLKWHLGLNQQQTSQLICHQPNAHFKAYSGYLGWAPGQLAEEIQKGLWLPVPMPSKRIFRIPNRMLWDTLMLQYYPSQITVKGFPNNPSFN